MSLIYKKNGVELLSPCCNVKMNEIHYYFTSINCSECKKEHSESDIENYNRKMKPVLEEVANSNVLIAHFMGLKRGDDWEVRIGDAQWCHPMDLQYNKSWDWLIPACKKCSDISTAQLRPSVNHCNKLDWIECEIGTYLRDYNMEKIFEQVIEFVTLYYKNNDIEFPEKIEFVK